MTFPLRLEGRDVHDDAAARIGALADAERQHVARNAEILDAAREREGVRWHEAGLAAHIDERAESNAFGSTTALKTLVKTLNSSATRKS